MHVRNQFFISRLTDKRATHVYGHVDILWTYQGAKIQMMLLA